MPGILVGAAYGRLIGVFVSATHQGQIDESTYALLGSASYMAGSMRLVVSVSVMLLELTNQLSLLPHMMLVLVIAKAVGDGSGVRGIYAIITAVKGFPVLPPRPGKALRHVTAADLVAHQGAPQSLARVERVGAIVAALRATQHNGFPVLDHPGRASAAAAAAAGPSGEPEAAATPRGPSQLLGTVLRHHLLVLLRSGRAFQHTPVGTHNSQRIAFMYDITDFDKPVSRSAPTIDDVARGLSAQAREMFVDLAPYVNPPSFVVQSSTCASHTYSLFTALGLRHLCVVPDTTAVLGVITRKDLVDEHAEDVISSKVCTTAAGDAPFPAARLSGELPRGSGSASGALVDLSGGAAPPGGLTARPSEAQPRPGRVGVVVRPPAPLRPPSLDSKER